MKSFKGYDKNNNEIWHNEKSERVCSASNCERESEKCGYCGRHYRQIQRHGRLTPELEITIQLEVPNNCVVNGCNEKHYALGYCKKHHWQYKNHGKILERTRFDKNEFVEFENYYEMILYDKNGNETNRTKISKEDYENIKEHKWYYSKSSGYVYGTVNGIKIALHRFITKAKEGDIPDHYSRDTLDNRRENLFIVDSYINAWNSLKHNIDKNYIKGVNYNDRDNLWRARLCCRYNTVLDESFIKKEDAIKSRLSAEKEYFGEFAPQRHLFKKYSII